ncbi:hypothetical protein SELMODRAFT_409377 [Selaginella moellendorffii]|uniref:Uncharacterized protein n=1 Tax=Selaginella moellendorffii TaxID=88036 RepID=D8RB95_SELML|nr:hypothetical protein SELMODRAFT_409377 [Selaginella moellendorffii]
MVLRLPVSDHASSPGLKIFGLDWPSQRSRREIGIAAILTLDRAVERDRGEEHPIAMAALVLVCQGCISRPPVQEVDVVAVDLERLQAGGVDQGRDVVDLQRRKPGRAEDLQDVWLAGLVIALVALLAKGFLAGTAKRGELSSTRTDLWMGRATLEEVRHTHQRKQP